MFGTLFRVRLRTSLLFAAAAAICVAAVSMRAQNDPNRPPWAQKSARKSAAPAPTPAKTDSTTSTSSTVHTAPPVPGDGPVRAPDPAAIPTSSSDEQQSNQRGKITVHVNLVSILASVLDEQNRPAPDLPVEAFQLFEEGVQQKIEVFETETKQPLDLALMIDASLSAHKEMAFEQEAAAHFIHQILRPEDRLSVFSFDESVHQLAGFSDNVSSLQQAVHKIADGAGTSIYDALQQGSRALEKRPEDRRRVIILVTDAGETTSRVDFEAARKEAVRSGSLLYTIVIRPIKNESGRNTAGEHALETITDTTGGAMFFPDSPQELNIIFDRIDRELRTQYRLGYYPNPRGPANTYRRIEVKVLDTYNVRYRKSYLTGPQ